MVTSVWYVVGVFGGKGWALGGRMDMWVLGFRVLVEFVVKRRVSM